MKIPILTVREVATRIACAAVKQTNMNGLASASDVYIKAVSIARYIVKETPKDETSVHIDPNCEHNDETCACG